MNDRKTVTDTEALQRQVNNLSKLVEINGIINSTLNINKLLSIIMEMIKDIMDTETSSLLLYDDDREELVFKVALGEVGDELKEKYRVKLGQGIAGWVALNRKDILVNDAYSDSRFDPMYDRNTGFTTKAILCSPLLFKGKLLGVIQAINPLVREEFDENDMNLFCIFSNQAALAVQNAIFFQKAIEEERIESELKTAQAIQESLTPPIDYIQGRFEVAARSLSAREVGGAFHFFREYADGIYNLTLGNINTRGIPGAMRASSLSGLFRSAYELDIRDPEIIINMVNKYCIDEIGCNAGLSLYTCLINIRDMSVQFVNSGDICPLLIRHGRAAYLRFLNKTRGYPGCKNFSATKITLNLERGDKFIVFSGSLPQLKNTDAKELGLPEIMRFIEQSNCARVELIDSLLDYAYKYTGGVERRKDISVVSFMVNG